MVKQAKGNVQIRRSARRKKGKCGNNSSYAFDARKAPKSWQRGLVLSAQREFKKICGKTGKSGRAQRRRGKTWGETKASDMQKSTGTTLQKQSKPKDGTKNAADSEGGA